MAQMLPNLTYALLLVAVLLTPYAAVTIKSSPAGTRSPLWLAAAAILAVAIILTAARLGHFAMLSIVLLVPLIGRGRGALLGGVAAIFLFAPVVWWRDPSQIGSLVAAGLFILLALAASFLPRLLPSPALPAEKALGPKILLPMILCAVVGVVDGLLTAPFSSVEPLTTAWHHWGAFLAPVDAWLSGGVPYRDFPVQYGLGPTVLLASVCGQDCWRAMYWTTVIANALYFATLAGGAMMLTWRLPRGTRWLALLALFCACFIWTGFPINFGAPVMTPSVAGLRFLPISALLLHILVDEQRAQRGAAPRDWIGHILWLADLFWSPEAAFFGTLLWWPYLAMRAAAQATDRSASPWIALLRGALIGAAALAVGSTALAVIVWLLSGRTLTPGDFFVYIQHPPGPLPVDLRGTVWLALACIALGSAVLAGQRLSSSGRMLYACLLGLLASGAYFLSRSHDNNILNLFPLLTLLLLATLAGLESLATTEETESRSFAGAFIHTILAAMIAFVALFNFEAWSDGIARNGLLQLGPERLVARFTPRFGEAPQPLPHNAIGGLDYLRQRGAGSVVLLEDHRIMPWQQSGKGWTSMNNLANFEPLPDAMIIHYIRRGAAIYRRPGWILVDNADYGRWVDLFRTAYDVREQKVLGTYTAYYLVPSKGEGSMQGVQP